MDQYTLVYLTGYSDFSITKRYVHPQADKVRSVESERTKRGVSILSTIVLKKEWTARIARMSENGL